MRAKLLKSITNNGEIPAEVEIVDGCDGYYYTCIIPDGRQISINSNLLEVIDYTPYIDWEKRRYEIAKAALIGLITRSDNVSNFDGKAMLSVNYADALIAELKKK